MRNVDRQMLGDGYCVDNSAGYSMVDDTKRKQEDDLVVANVA